MKKKMFILILMLSFIFIGNVKAEISTAKVIGGTKYGELMCAYLQTDTSVEPKEYARAAIYYNSDSGEWTVLWDNKFFKEGKWEKSKVKHKTGTFSYVFSRDDDNVWIGAGAKTALLDKYECPIYGGIKTSGSNRPCFGSSEGEPECKKSSHYKKHVLVYELTKSYLDNLTPEEIAELEMSIDNSRDFNQFIGDAFCINGGVKKALRIVGYVIVVARYLVPIIIIITGSFDLFKSVVVGTSDSLTQQFKKFGVRLAIGLSIFFIPLVIHAVLNITDLLPLEYDYCEKCLFDPDSCQ